MVMDKTTMSIQELSAQMSISLPKAYALVKQPGFPTIKIGTRIIIPIEASRNGCSKRNQRLTDTKFQWNKVTTSGIPDFD